MAIPMIAAMAGSTISAWGKYKAGEAEAGAFQGSAIAKRRAAKDLIKRSEINSEFSRLAGETFKGKQIGAFASSGIDVGSGLALSVLEDTAKKIQRQIMVDEMEAEAQKDMLLLDADLDWDRAKAADTAGKIGAFSSLAGGFMQAWS